MRVEATAVPLGHWLDVLRLVPDGPPDEQAEHRWDYPSELSGVVTDRMKLKQLLVNIIHNAVKFT